MSLLELFPLEIVLVKGLLVERSICSSAKGLNSDLILGRFSLIEFCISNYCLSPLKILFHYLLAFIVDVEKSVVSLIVMLLKAIYL